VDDHELQASSLLNSPSYSSVETDLDETIHQSQNQMRNSAKQFVMTRAHVLQSSSYQQRRQTYSKRSSASATFIQAGTATHALMQLLIGINTDININISAPSSSSSSFDHACQHSCQVQQ